MTAIMDAKYCRFCETILLDAQERELGEHLNELANCCDNPSVIFLTGGETLEGDTDVKVIPDGK